MNIRHTLLAAAIASALTGQQSVLGATITVTTDSDSLLVDSRCTLRGAVSAANSNAPVGGCAAGSAGMSDLIEFSPSVLGRTITLENGQITIASPMTIDGSAGATRGTTVSGNNSSRLFNISDGDNNYYLNVTLRGLTLTQGFVSDDNGGAITNDGESVRIEACIITGNEAIEVVDGGYGGAIENFGDMVLTGSTVSNNRATQDGGAVINYGGMLTLIDTTVSGNTATSGGGIRSQPGPGGNPPDLLIEGGVISNNRATTSGGGIAAYNTATLSGTTLANNSANSGGAVLMVSPSTQLVITDSEISGNTANTNGGALANASLSLINITNSQLRNNLAGGSAGAIFSQGSTTLSDSVVTENVAAGGYGGAIRHFAPDNLTITNSQLTLNESSGRGGAIHTAGPVSLVDSAISGNVAQADGGGIYALSGLTATRSTLNSNTASNGAATFSLDSATALLTNVTVSNNLATAIGGPDYPSAIYASGPLSVRNSTLVANAPHGMTKANGVGNWVMLNTVIADSVQTDCVDALTSLAQNTHNFIADGSCSADGIHFSMGDPMLGPLSNTGGPTNVHAPLSGSPLVDAGDTSLCVTEDQTGMPRPIDGNSDDDAECDIGSVEFVDLFPPLANLTDAPTVTRPGDTSYEVEVTYTDLDGAVNFASVGPTDITVLPGPLAVQSVALAGTTTQLVAIYRVTPPNGAWDPSDSGSYTVSVNADEVVDTATTGINAVSAAGLGSFTVVIADLDVLGNGVSIAAGDVSPSTSDNTDFADVPIQNARSRLFTITNAGAGSIDLIEPVAIAGTGFTISQPGESALNAGDTTQFQITFAPTAVGMQSATVTIVTNLSDENPYTFTVAGTGVAATEDIFADGFESSTASP